MTQLRRMLVIGPVLAAMALMMTLGASTALAAGNGTQQVSTPFSGFTITNTCSGEDVLLTDGFEHDIFHITMSASGGFDIVEDGNLQSVSGVGLTSGAKYQLTGHFHDAEHLNAAENETLVEHENLVGQGPDNNQDIQELEHITVDANGNITSTVDSFSFTCH